MPFGRVNHHIFSLPLSTPTFFTISPTRSQVNQAKLSLDMSSQRKTYQSLRESIPDERYSSLLPGLNIEPSYTPTNSVSNCVNARSRRRSQPRNIHEGREVASGYSGAGDTTWDQFTDLNPYSLTGLSHNTRLEEYPEYSSYEPVLELYRDGSCSVADGVDLLTENYLKTHADLRRSKDDKIKELWRRIASLETEVATYKERLGVLPSTVEDVKQETSTLQPQSQASIQPEGSQSFTVPVLSNGSGSWEEEKKRPSMNVQSADSAQGVYQVRTSIDEQDKRKRRTRGNPRVWAAGAIRSGEKVRERLHRHMPSYLKDLGDSRLGQLMTRCEAGFRSRNG